MAPKLLPRRRLAVEKKVLELGSVIGSDLFEHDEYIKSYLQENPDLSLSSVIKIVFSYFITPRLISELEEFKTYLKAVNFFMFEEVFGKSHRRQARV